MRISSLGSGSYASLLNNLTKKQNALNSRFANLASGKRSAQENPASAAIAQRLISQASGYKTVNTGIEAAQGTLSIAEGALSSVADDLMRMRELAVQASNGILSNTERGLIATEFNELRENIDSTAGSASYNGTELLDGEFASSLQVGPDAGDTIDVEIDEVSTSSLGVSGLDLSTQEGAEDAIEAIDAALEEVNSQRAQLGAYNSRLESAYNSNSVAAENLETASSTMMDIDYVDEIAKMTLEKIQVLATLKALKAQTTTQQNFMNELFNKLDR